MENDHFETALDKFNEYIKARNMRQTPERKAILAKVLGMGSHFDVDELYNALDKEYHVSRATVYNNVELLCQCNILRKHFLSETLGVYELVEDNHLHLICTVCGKIKVVKDDLLGERISAMKFRGFTPAYFSTNIYGVCSSCNRKSRKKSSSDDGKTKQK